MSLRIDPTPCDDSVTRENWGIQDLLNNQMQVTSETATSTVQDFGGDPYVTSAGGNIYLPGARDPNVRPGDNVPFIVDKDGRRVAIGGWKDDPIGTVKMWKGDLGDIPPGWQQCVEGVGSFLKGANVWGAETAAGNTGSSTVTITGNTAAEDPAVSGVTDAASGNTGDASPGLTGETDYATTGLTVDAASGNTGNASPGLSGSTDSATTGITIANASGSIGSATTGITVNTHADHIHAGIATLVQDGTSKYVMSCDAFGNQTGGILGSPLGHTVNDSGHTHSLGSHSHSVTEPSGGSGHAHALTGVSVASHNHSLGSHTHTITEGSGHKHGAGTLAVASHNHTLNSHTHSFDAIVDPHVHGAGGLSGSSHSHTAGEPASMTVVLIERVD